MINQFLSGIVALFIWGKTSSKTIEKILKASKWRTFIYGFLTLVVSVFFYKTYQVATVYNMVQISGLKQGCDKSGHVVDTVKNVCIINRFAENSMQQSKLYSQAIDKYTFNKDADKELSKIGGAHFGVLANARPDTFVTRKIKGWTEEDQAVLIHDFAKRNIPIDKINHLYQLSFAATSVTDILPFYPEISFVEELQKYDDYIFFDYEVMSTRNNPLISFSYNGKNKDSELNSVGEDPQELPDILNNGVFCKEIVGTVNLPDSILRAVELGFFTVNSFVNKFGVFTAADISQYDYMLTINSDCPIDRLYIDYDIPIETAPVSSHMHVGTKGITFDKEMVKQMQNVPSMIFHIKIPSLANLQLIRSLVLTTLLTALFSLFCRNLYYSIRKWAYNNRKKKRLPVATVRSFSSKQKENIKRGVRSYRRILLGLLISVIVLIAIDTIVVFLNTSILLPIEVCNNLILLPFVILLLSVLAIYYGYMKVQKPLQHALSGIEETDSQSPDDEMPFIFVHERDEEEEYDNLVEEQLEEGDNGIPM